MFLVTYKIKEGDKDYHEYSWFEMGTQSDYDAGVIKDKVLIQEVYGDEEEEIFENNFDVLTLFDKNRFKQRRDSGEFLTATSAAGKSLVLKQTTDLGGTTNYKFNKIKL